MKALQYFLLFVLSTSAVAKESTCYGATGSGRLENGVKLPDAGKNFKSYGTIPRLAGRTYVHSKVWQIVVDAYKILETEQPEKRYKYAETGLKNGGKFKPHKIHRNGLSVDFMVPVQDKEGQPVHLPTHAFNKYGYAIEFDDRGQHERYKIDYQAMGAHIVALHKAAKNSGADTWRVVFAPELQTYLYNSKYGPYIRDNVRIPKKRSWVRHDEHYHVDFSIPCEPI